MRREDMCILWIEYCLKIKLCTFLFIFQISLKISTYEFEKLITMYEWKLLKI